MGPFRLPIHGGTISGPIDDPSPIKFQSPFGNSNIMKCTGQTVSSKRPSHCSLTHVNKVNNNRFPVKKQVEGIFLNKVDLLLPETSDHLTSTSDPRLGPAEKNRHRRKNRPFTSVKWVEQSHNTPNLYYYFEDYSTDREPHTSYLPSKIISSSRELSRIIERLNH